MPAVRIFVSFLTVYSGLLPCLMAAEQSARELISADSALVLEINRPLELIENPLCRSAWQLLRETYGVKQALQSPEVDKFRQVSKFIEKSLGGDWQSGIRRLTEGGEIGRAHV